MERVKTWRIPDEEKRRVESILAEAAAGEPDVVFAYLYGSFLEGEAFRDVDIAAFLDPLPAPPGPQKAALRQAGLSLLVDVQVLNATPPAFRFAAIRPCRILLCRDEDRHADFEASTWSESFEIRRLHEAYLRGAL